MTAGLVPLFTSAPRLRLTINGTPAAYAIGFNMNVAVDVQPVQVLGQFEAASLEPVLYNVVTGTMQIIKLISSTAQAGKPSGLQADPLIGDATTLTKDPTTGKTKPLSGAGTSPNANSILSLNGLAMHLDPTTVLASRTFDMDLQIQVPTANGLAVATALANGADTTGTTDPAAVPNSITNGTGANATKNQVLWMRIQYCRLTSRNTNIASGQLVNEPVNFQGLLATPFDAAGNQLFFLDDSTNEKPNG